MVLYSGRSLTLPFKHTFIQQCRQVLLEGIWGFIVSPKNTLTCQRVEKTFKPPTLWSICSRFIPSCFPLQYLAFVKFYEEEKRSLWRADLVKGVHWEEDDPGNVQGFDYFPGHCGLSGGAAATQTCDMRHNTHTFRIPLALGTRKKNKKQKNLLNLDWNALHVASGYH